MQTRLKDKNDIKIFILYLLKNVGYALDFSNINDIVVQDGVVNYFDFAECFAELIDAGNIREDAASEAGEATYSLTEQGKQVSATVIDNNQFHTSVPFVEGIRPPAAGSTAVASLSARAKALKIASRI